MRGFEGGEAIPYLGLIAFKTVGKPRKPLLKFRQKIGLKVVHDLERFAAGAYIRFDSYDAPPVYTHDPGICMTPGQIYKIHKRDLFPILCKEPQTV